MPIYRAFGLTLETDRLVPGLVPLATSAHVDVRIWFDASGDAAACALAQEAWYVAQELHDGVPALRVWRLGAGAGFRLRYADGTEFLVDGAGAEVRATWPASSTLEDTATYLLGPVLGFVLRRRGVCCLHASAVALGSRAVAFVGAPYAGKSTIAAALVKAGHRALSDDIVALALRDGVPHAVPAFAQLRLWPDSVALLYGSADALPPLTPTWDKRGLALSGADAFQDRPMPLAAIYLLDERSPDGSPRIGSLGGRAGLLALLGNSYVSYLMERPQREQEFDFLSRLVTRMPVRRLSVPDASHAAELGRTILEDCETARCTPSPITAR
jgi:hypothetical protein